MTESVSSMIEHVAQVFSEATGYEVVLPDLRVSGFVFAYNDDGSITIETTAESRISVTLLPKVEE